MRKPELLPRSCFHGAVSGCMELVHSYDTPRCNLAAYTFKIQLELYYFSSQTHHVSDEDISAQALIGVQ